MQNKAPEHVWLRPMSMTLSSMALEGTVKYVRDDICRAPEPVAVTEEISAYEFMANEFDRLAVLRKMWSAQEVAATIRRMEIPQRPAALAAQPAAEWQDMDSAPKDGTRFLALEGTRHFDCWWHDAGYGEAYWQDEADSEPDPHYWRPLPPPPAQEVKP